MFSRLQVGVTHVEQSLLYGNAEAETRARAALGASLSCQATHIHSFGLSDLWPEPGGEPTNWASLDNQMGSMAAVGLPIAITLYNLPWWMKGVWAGGVTTPLTSAQRFSDDGRLLTDRQADWRLLVRRVCERVLPLGVRHFKIGQEGKGYYMARDGTPNRWDFDDYPGTSGQADMGFTHFYKITAAEIMAVAAEMGVADIELAGPYPRLAFLGNPTSACVPLDHPLRGCTSGVPMRAPIEAAETFLDLVQAQGMKLDRFTYDMGCRNKDGVIVEPDDWRNLERYREVALYWRGQLDSRGLDVPIDLAEWYAKPQLDPGPTGEALRVALKAHALMIMAEAGLSECYAWSPFGLGDEPGDTRQGAMITPTNTADGGAAKPLCDVLALLKAHFGPGVWLKPVTSGALVSALASNTRLLLVNRTAQPVSVFVEGRTIELAPYAVQLEERAMASELILINGDVTVELQGNPSDPDAVQATNLGASPWRVQVRSGAETLFDEVLDANSTLACHLESTLAVQVGPVG